MFLFNIDSTNIAITPPPGTPGAATIVTPNITMNGSIIENVGTCPFIYITAIDARTKVIVSPAKFIVAPKGITKSATSWSTLFSLEFQLKHIELLNKSLVLKIKLSIQIQKTLK